MVELLANLNARTEKRTTSTQVPSHKGVLDYPFYRLHQFAGKTGNREHPMEHPYEKAPGYEVVKRKLYWLRKTLTSPPSNHIQFFACSRTEKKAT